MENKRKSFVYNNPPFHDLPEIVESRKGMVFNTKDFLEIYHRVQKIKPDAKRNWGKMNLVQMLNHLKVATGSALGAYHLKDESSFLWRVVIKFVVIRILHRLPKNAKAANGFKIEMNNVLDFEFEKEQLREILRKAFSSRNKSYQHPLFGTMTREEWGILIYRHFDHHLRQFSS
jgi:hypothetical protein